MAPRAKPRRRAAFKLFGKRRLAACTQNMPPFSPHFARLPLRSAARRAATPEPHSQALGGRCPVWYPLRVPDPQPASDARGVAVAALAHLDALYAFAWRLTHDNALAEDLVQDTFARCLTGAQSFSPGSNLKAWLFRILRNGFIDQRRREGRSPLRASAELEATPSSESNHQPDQLRHLAAQDIEAALQALSEDQRSVVLLDLEGFSEHETAEVMGCAPGTVKSRLARARAALRSHLQEYAR
jgi:RNA polymerase sigma-70 factor (ECF subfamily)